MTRDEARDLFGDVVEGTLDPSKKEAFEAVLAADAELREELEAYRAVIGSTHRIAERDADLRPSVDLLHGVQTRLRRRSRGRYYRDRFSEAAGLRAGLPLLVAILVAVLVATAWVATQSMIAIEPAIDREAEGPGSPP